MLANIPGGSIELHSRLNPLSHVAGGDDVAATLATVGCFAHMQALEAAASVEEQRVKEDGITNRCIIYEEQQTRRMECISNISKVKVVAENVTERHAIAQESIIRRSEAKLALQIEDRGDSTLGPMGFGLQTLGVALAVAAAYKAWCRLSPSRRWLIASLIIVRQTFSWQPLLGNAFQSTLQSLLQRQGSSLSRTSEDSESQHTTEAEGSDLEELLASFSCDEEVQSSIAEDSDCGTFL